MDSRFESCESRRLLALIEIDEAPDATVAANPTVVLPEAMPQVEGYRVIGRLGEGGMGTVWRAVQLRTRRQVALKLLSTRSFVSDHARQRFEREVELTARLEHPNIARLYDSGSCGGVYFYAMELIDGTHLDEYVAAEKLDRAQILQLMWTVCNAVNHAHQRGIIHRDLKPSNILVDGAGQPHVVDFGLARMVLDSEAGQEALTLDGQMAGTLAFMAPEQAAGQTSRLDTRTDVYGLGATMYLLLVGQPAHGPHGPRYQVLKRIADDEVTPPRVLNRELDAELEAMLLKALDRNSDRRYGTAGELAQDISRYLSNEPMEAVPPSSLYKLRKFAGKHRTAMSVAAGFALLLLLGTAVSSWQAIRATRARTAALAATARAQQARLAAEREAVRAKAVSDFMLGILSRARPMTADHTMNVMDLLDAVSKQIGPTLKGQPEVEIRVRSELARAYHRMGMDQLAANHIREALRLSRSLPGGADSKLALEVATELPPIPTLGPGDAKAAVPSAQATYESAMRTLGPSDPVTREAAANLASALMQRADRIFGHEQDLAAAEQVLRTIVGPFDQAPSRGDPPVAFRDLHLFCNLLITERKFTEAASFADAALKRAAIDPSCLPLDRAYLHSDLVDALASNEQLDDAAAAARNARDFDRKNLGTDNEVTQTLLKKFVDILRRQGRDEDASQLIEEDLRWVRGLFPEDEVFVADLLRKLGRIRMDLGDNSGMGIFEQGAAMQRRIFGPQNATGGILAREVLLHQLGSTKQPPNGKLAAQVFCAMEDLFRDEIVRLPEASAVSAAATHYAVARWQPSGNGETVANGSLADIANAPDLPPGIYLLWLEIPVAGSDPLSQAMWILVSNWKIETYDGKKVGRFSQHAWPAILESNRSHSTSPSLAFNSALKGRPGPQTHFGLSASTSIDLPAGRYRFAVTSDDGARLFVDGQRIINAWSDHSVQRDFRDVELDSGKHALRVDYFEEGDRFNLWVTVEPRSATAAALAASHGAHPRRSVAVAIEQTTDSEHPESLAARAVLHAMTGMYKQAADEYEAAIDMDPTDELWWQNRALLSLQIGDQVGYSRWIDGMLERATPTGDPSVGARTAIAACMGDTTAVDNRVKRLIENRAADQIPPAQRSLHQLARGIVEYRDGEFRSAAATLGAAAKGRLTAAASATAQIFRARALHHLDSETESRSAFDQAQKMIASLPSADREEIDSTEMQDRLICDLAARQAAADIPAIAAGAGR